MKATVGTGSRAFVMAGSPSSASDTIDTMVTPMPADFLPSLTEEGHTASGEVVVVCWPPGIHAGGNPGLGTVVAMTTIWDELVSHGCEGGAGEGERRWSAELRCHEMYWAADQRERDGDGVGIGAMAREDVHLPQAAHIARRQLDTCPDP